MISIALALSIAINIVIRYAELLIVKYSHSFLLSSAALPGGGDTGLPPRTTGSMDLTASSTPSQVTPVFIEMFQDSNTELVVMATLALQPHVRALYNTIQI